jgi:hypothetical protein
MSMIKQFKDGERYYYVWVNQSDRMVSQVRERICDMSFNHYLDGSFRNENEAIKYRESFIRKGYRKLKQ